MQLLKVVFMLLICNKAKCQFHELEADSIDFCQTKVIEECSEHSKGLLEAIENGSGRRLEEECDLLQATIDCISVPRCAGNLLQGFRYLVLMTATTLKKSSHSCHKLDVKMLERYVKGLTTACDENKIIKDTCDRKCKCVNGDLQSCSRVRKEFTKMSLEERTRFINAFKLVSTDPRYKDDYRKLTIMYSQIPSNILTQTPHIFLPWYRGYLLELENILRQIDCRITMPYWDWSIDAAHWTRDSEIEDVWNSGPHGLGSNGVFPDMCVMDGPFKKGEFFLPWYASGGCLKRNFNQSCNLPNAEDVQTLQEKENFTVFVEVIREVFLWKIRDCVGESMQNILTATFTPEFWLHHTFIDKLWAKWERHIIERQLVHYRNTTFKMPGLERFAWEYMSLNTLPGGVIVVYEE